MKEFKLQMQDMKPGIRNNYDNNELELMTRAQAPKSQCCLGKMEINV